MKLSKGGSYLKADTTDKGSVITFKDQGTIEVSDKYRYKNEDGTDGEFRKSLVFLVEYKGEEKKLRINAGSKISCIEAWGDETSDWVGRKATIHILPTPKGDQKMIVLDPITDRTVPKGKVIKPEDIAWKD